jgi:hypothetical protein
MPDLKTALWGSALWGSGFFVHSVGHPGSESVIRRYVNQQGIKDYQPFHTEQLDLFAEADEADQAGKKDPRDTAWLAARGGVIN